METARMNNDYSENYTFMANLSFWLKIEQFHIVYDFSSSNWQQFFDMSSPLSD